MVEDGVTFFINQMAKERIDFKVISRDILLRVTNIMPVYYHCIQTWVLCTLIDGWILENPVVYFTKLNQTNP